MKRKLEFNNEKGCNFHIYLSCHEESACCDIDVANKQVLWLLLQYY